MTSNASAPSSASAGLNATERRATLGLAGIYGFRMLGLFLILPVFALYADELPGATPLLAGLAVGIYGLTQALLQIPFGLLSDRIGRKPVIIGGLLLFALGSIIAAMADTIWWVILGRTIQGAGAISAAIMALAADLTRDEQRTKTMAVIGMTIGFSFAVALLSAPYLNHWVGLSGIFWFTALLAGLGLLLLILVVPSPQRLVVHRDAQPIPALFGEVLSIRELLRLDFGIFTLHLVLTSLFLVVPLALRDAGLAPEYHTWIYLPILLLSIAAMVPFIILAERKGRMRPVFLGAIAALALALLGMRVWTDQLWGIAVMLWLYFSAVNLLEAMLPSLVSKIAPAGAKGTAMGVYTTSQFAGAFLGGLLGGWVHGVIGASGIFLFGAGALTLWLLVAWGMANPRAYSTELAAVGPVDDHGARELAQRLLGLPGVAEASVVPEEGVAYLKIDRSLFDRQQLDDLIATAT